MNAVVRLETPETEGAGVVAGLSDDAAFIVTAKHVVPKAKVDVYFNAARHKKHTGRVIHVSDEIEECLDLAVLVVDLPAGEIRRSLRPLDVRQSRLEPLAPVANISHLPDVWGLNAGVNKVQSEKLNTVTLSKVGILEGASGGPLLDSDNRLAGMITDVDGVKATALKIKPVLEVLRLWNVRANRLGIEYEDPKILLTDRFEDNRNNWYVSNDRQSPAGVKDGRYLLASIPGEWRFTTAAVALDPSRPFRISAKVTKLRGHEDHFYGVMWGVADANHFFNLAITGSGHVAVTMKKDDAFTNFNEMAFVNPHVRRGDNATNLLTIARTEDDLMQFSINGKVVHEMPFQPFFGPMLGFLVYQDVHIAVDDLEVVGVPKR